MGLSTAQKHNRQNFVHNRPEPNTAAEELRMYSYVLD